jgi:CheY-like chemotaxis protein
VLAAPSGENAVELLRNGARPDAVLLDLIMPRMSGFETLRAIRAIDPDLPVLISTGYVDRGTSEALVSEGADGFVNKPYHIETLEQALQKARRESKPRE